MSRAAAWIPGPMQPSSIPPKLPTVCEILNPGGHLSYSTMVSPLEAS